MTQHRPAWPELLRVAQDEVLRVLRGLPAPLRQRAKDVPVVYQPQPTAAQTEDGIADDLMGLFVGLPFPESESGALEISPQIFLFLANIWDEAGADERGYRQEVRTTYLHELGHFLGLEEDDLEARGLE